MKQMKAVTLWLFLSLLVFSCVGATARAANGPTAPFALEVAPSPIVETVTPGEQKTIELRIRNAGTGTEKLKMELRSFSNADDGTITFEETAPPGLKDWVRFDEPQFELRSGEWFTQKVQMNVPQNAAFSYSFAILISRTQQSTPLPGQTTIQGSVAVYTLINVDKPGARRSFAVESFSSAKRLYEYLPASFNFTVRNTGNAIVRPEGNVFIQRSSSSQPIAVLKLNPNGSYILPESQRDLKTSWNDGFPVFVQQKAADNAAEKTVLQWDWSKAQQLRFGRYVAKMVAVYNDGQRDVPIQAEVTFWVIPWKVLLVGLLLVAVLLVGAVAIVRNVMKVARRARRTPSAD